MTIKLINKKDIKDIEISENTTIADILKKEEIPIETVVVKLNGDTVTEDEKVKNGDELEIIKVIYGGEILFTTKTTIYFFVLLYQDPLEIHQYVLFLYVALKLI